jgi:predicted nucleic acid-binding protein
MNRWCILEKLRIGFEGRIFSFTAETAVCWGNMCARAESDGHTMAAFDSIIAAKAIEQGLVVVT